MTELRISISGAALVGRFGGREGREGMSRVAGILRRGAEQGATSPG